MGYTEVCVDVVTQHCTETSVQVQTSSHLVGRVAGAHLAAGPALVAGPHTVAGIPAALPLTGVHTAGLVAGALPIAPAGALPIATAGALPVSPAGAIVDAAAPAIIAEKQLVKREADAEADADADAQFLFGHGIVGALAPRVPIAAAPV